MVKSVLFTKQKEKSKEKDKEKDNEFLCKKRPEPDTPKKDVDMVKIKKKINEIMYSICTPNISSQNDNIDYIYQSMHKNYLLNEFTSNCLNYINKIIIDVNKNHLKKFQGLFELNKLFISIIKELLMNEFELLLLSLYLESIDLSLNSDVFPFKDSLIYLCYFIKKLTLSTEKLSPINSFLIRKYQGFEDKFNKWFQSNSSIFNAKLYFSYMEINQRFKEYNISYSIYCKNNYIDYNLIIDRILTMSIPYNECKNDNLFIDKKNNSTDLLLENNSNLNTNSFQNFSENKNNINEILFTTNNNTNNFNNNKINNLYSPNFIPTFPPSVFINPNNNIDINLGYIHNGNKNNIIFNNSKNNKNNNNNDQIINKEFTQTKQNESNNMINFKISNLNNINTIHNKSTLNVSKNIQLNEDNQMSTITNNKPLFITEEKKKKEENKIEEDKKNDKSNNINNDINLVKNEKHLEKPKMKETSITPNKLLYSLDDENINNTNQNHHIYNFNNFNLTDKMYKQIKNDKNNMNNLNIINNLNNINNLNTINNNLIKNNEGINVNSNQNQNNILGFNPPQIHDYNPLKYNNNLGINDFNPSSQLSFLSSKNPIFVDLNNLYHSSFHGIDQDENMKQLYQSNDNFFRSCLSINSSKNFFPIINNINYGNNNNGNTNIGDSGNFNNMNYPPINQMMLANTAFLNINNGLNNNLNYGKNIEKKAEDNNKNNKNIDEK